MPKLKLTRDQLHVLTVVCNPGVVERRISRNIKGDYFQGLDFLFILMDLGEKLTTKFYFNSKSRYNLTVKYSEAAALVSLIAELENGRWDPFSLNTLMMIKGSLHQDLINYQKRIN